MLVVKLLARTTPSVNLVLQQVNGIAVYVLLDSQATTVNMVRKKRKKKEKNKKKNKNKNKRNILECLFD